MTKSLIKWKSPVKWEDAADRDGVSLKDIMDNPTTKWMSHKESHGKVIKEDEFGIVILREKDDEDECDITVIPKPWIKPPEEEKCRT